MGIAKQVLEAALGRFVCDDGGIYKGQCPQLPKHFARELGLNWQGVTYNGNKTVDRLVELGGYYGDGNGYRIASCDVDGSQYGHTWVELNDNGQWVIYEQNANRAGAKAADFGCGTCYSVTKTTNPGTWRKNVRYAAHPAIDAYIRDHDEAPAPAPTKSNEEIADEVIRGDWGNGEDRKNRLTAAGYDYAAIQAIVNQKLAPAPTPAPAAGTFAVGDKVVPTRLVDYNGTPLTQWDPVYTITEINGNRAVLSARGAVWAAMRTEDIRKA